MKRPNNKNNMNQSPKQIKTTNATSVYDIITERIISLLEQGTVPWQKPWKVQSGMPRNLVSKKPYRGINAFLLHSMQYESPFWLTFKQAQEHGGKIRKGARACPVVFWKPIEIKDQKTGEAEKIPFLRYYHVFNLAQCEGLSVNNEAPAEPTPAGQIVENMPQRPDIKHGMNAAFYSPSVDTVGMPSRERFQIEAGYFATLFHELIHSTGHEKRLNRSTLLESSGFGSDPYCKEELIAEMGAAFLCGHAGIVEITLNNSAAYLDHWLKQLNEDKTLIVRAAAQAQKAADFILATTFNEANADPS